MADTAAKARAAEAVYTTSRALGTGTTSTVTMEIWRMLSEHLLASSEPMNGSELSKVTGLSVEQIDTMFSQDYYQKYYGFRRFNSYAAWKEWAMAEGVLFNPDLHALPTDEVEDDLDEDEDEATEE